MSNADHNIWATAITCRVEVRPGREAPWIAKEELEKGALVSLPLGARKLRRRWGVAHLKGRRLALAEETFVGLCDSVIEVLGLKNPKAGPEAA